MTSARDNLVKAAKKLLWERGYESTSPGVILEESGAGQGSLYYHFTGKKHLALTALEDVSDDMRQSNRDMLSPTKDPLERIKSYLLAPRDGQYGCKLGRLAFETAIMDDELRAPVERYFTDLQKRLAEAVRQAQDLGQLATTFDADDFALTIAAVVQGGFLLSRIRQDRSLAERASISAWRLVEALIATKPA